MIPKAPATQHVQAIPISPYNITKIGEIVCTEPRGRAIF